MNVFFLTLLVLLSPVAMAEKFITRIHSISFSDEPSELHLVKFENSRVGFLPIMFEELTKGDLIEVELDESSRVLSLEKIVSLEDEILMSPPFVTGLTYEPSIVTNDTAIRKILSSFRPSYGNTSGPQDRAHIWAWEAYETMGLKSMKAFLFFSNNYIRKNQAKFWFHTSLYVLHEHEGHREEIVLDKKLSPLPLTFKAWTQKLMKSESACADVQKFSEYSLSKSHHDCFLIKASMYYWQPKDLEALEFENFERNQFFEWEIKKALQLAFAQ